MRYFKFAERDRRTFRHDNSRLGLKNDTIVSLLFPLSCETNMAKTAILPGHTIQICVNVNKSVTKQSLPVFPANIKKQVASAIPILLTKGHARLW
ncbi:Hypothetical protein BSPT2_I1019 [Brucella suis bv. 2]|nr:Hypothetical protein BSPT2_I1019 [Brucella suis bv. 2]